MTTETQTTETTATAAPVVANGSASKAAERALIAQAGKVRKVATKAKSPTKAPAKADSPKAKVAREPRFPDADPRPPGARW